MLLSVVSERSGAVRRAAADNEVADPPLVTTRGSSRVRRVNRYRRLARQLTDDPRHRVPVDRTDSELLEAIADGDRQALHVLYNRHARWLLLRLRRRSADQQLNEEAVQDCFVKVWRKAHSYRGDGDVGAWLWRISMRTLLDRLRKRTPTPMEFLPGRRETVRSTEDQVLVGLQHGELGPALDRLSPELRAVLQATVLDGLTTREAAELLGIPQGTVKTRAMRARQQLREEFA